MRVKFLENIHSSNEQEHQIKFKKMLAVLGIHHVVPKYKTSVPQYRMLSILLRKVFLLVFTPKLILIEDVGATCFLHGYYMYVPRKTLQKKLIFLEIGSQRLYCYGYRSGYLVVIVCGQLPCTCVHVLFLVSMFPAEFSVRKYFLKGRKSYLVSLRFPFPRESICLL